MIAGGSIRNIFEGGIYMKLFSIDYIPGADIEAIGLVKGAVVMSKNIGKDIGAGFKTIIGR